MGVMGAFGHSKTIRWCHNLKFGYEFDGSSILFTMRYVSPRSTMGTYDAIYLLRMQDLFMGKPRLRHHGGICLMVVLILKLDILYVLIIW